MSIPKAGEAFKVIQKFCVSCTSRKRNKLDGETRGIGHRLFAGVVLAHVGGGAVFQHGPIL